MVLGDNDEQLLDEDTGEDTPVAESDVDPVALAEEEPPDRPTPPPSDLGEDVEEEIKRVLVVDEPKAKGQLLPEDLINKPLEPEDLYDEGRI